MGILTWIIVGGIAGFLASVIQGRGYGLISSIIIGIVGALLGGWLSTQIFNLPYTVSGFNLTSVLVATAGAVVILFVLGLLKR
jgi:uncharacterized membrane protein YeaQ/YmgE (transglycosylase-associated protein family)